MSKDRGYVVLAWTAIFAALGSLAVSIWTAVFVHAHSPTAEQMDRLVTAIHRAARAQEHRNAIDVKVPGEINYDATTKP